MSRKAQRAKAIAPLPHLWWLTGLLFVLGLAAYWNAFDVPFVFDDLLSIQRNAAVRFGEFSWYLLNARSILYLTFTLNSLWTGQEVWSYHLINLALHLFNAILLFFLALRVFARVDADQRRCRVYAFLASAFFLLHPVQTESVTYISSRSELLSTTFYLVAFLLFVRWPEQRIGFLFSLLIVPPFLLGLGAKETVISLPAIIFLYDFIFLSHGSFRPMLARWRFYITFFVGGIAAAYYIATVALKGSIGAGLEGHLSTGRYFLTQLRVIVKYVQLTFLPVGLNLDYDFRPSTSPFEPAVIASFVFLSAIVVGGWLLRKRSPVASFSIFWFFLTLAPTSSVVPILDVIFEHRLYLPMVGVCLSFPVLIALLHTELRRRLNIQFKEFGYAAIVLALLLVGTVMRNQVWRDEVRLWTDIVAKSPHKDRAYNSLAWAYFKKGQYEPATKALETALRLVPGKQTDFTETLGNLYLKTGRYDEAVELFKKTLDQKNIYRTTIAYNNLGVAYLYKWQKLLTDSQGRQDQAFLAEREKILRPAAEAFGKAVELDGGFFPALDSYINVCSYLGLQDQLEVKALLDLEHKEEFNDLYTIGKVAFQRNNFARAAEFFERAEKVKSADKLVYFNHGYALNMLGQKDRAIEKYLMAIRVDPIFIEAHHNAALIYMDQKNYAAAIEHFAEVLRYDPNHVSTNVNLAKVYSALGDKEAARRYLKTVLTAFPGNPQAQQTWQALGL